MPANIKNPAIKRIHADVRELMKDPSDQYYAAPLESDLFEWHFTIRGPAETEFEGGVYHGRILLPPEYPFRPPDIVFTTPNGRFKVGIKICLTISSYHPEFWQPAWGIRLILEALISFFPSPSHGAFGGLDWKPEERKRLAVASHEWKCYKCGLAKELVPELRGKPGAGDPPSQYADQIKELHKFKAKTAKEITAESADAAAVDDDSSAGWTDRNDGTPGDAARAPMTPPTADRPTDETSGETGAVSQAAVTESSDPAGDGGSSLGSGGGYASPAGVADRSEVAAARATGEQTGEAGGMQGEDEDDNDTMLSFFAVAIVLAIVAILVRKALRYLDEV